MLQRGQNIDNLTGNYVFLLGCVTQDDSTTCSCLKAQACAKPDADAVKVLIFLLCTHTPFSFAKSSGAQQEQQHATLLFLRAIIAIADDSSNVRNWEIEHALLICWYHVTSQTAYKGDKMHCISSIIQLVRGM